MWPSELAHFAPAVWIGRLVNRGHACCPGLQRKGVNKSSFVNVHARSPFCLWSQKMSSNLSLFHCNNVFNVFYFSKPHFFYKEHKSPPENKRGAPHPTGTITLQCSLALESLLLLEAVLTVDTGLEGPKSRYTDPGFCKAGGNRKPEATAQGTPFWGKRERPRPG